MNMRRTGFTLLELVLALTVITIALLALLSAILSSQSLQRTTKDRTIAMHALSDRLEHMSSIPLNRLADEYGPGTFGATFDVRGLDVVPGDPAGQVGAITLFTDETVQLAEMGLPRDLDGDGETTTTDITQGRMVLVPVELRVRWLSHAGAQEIAIHSMLARR